MLGEAVKAPAIPGVLPSSAWSEVAPIRAAFSRVRGGGEEEEREGVDPCCPFKSMTGKRNIEYSLLTSHWLEINHRATLGCKECWEM